MKQLLSAEELAELLTAVTEGQAPSSPAPPEPRERAVGALDFRQPARLARDQLRAIRHLHDQAAAALSTAWSTLLRGPVEATVVAVEAVSFGALASAIASPAFIQIFRITSPDGDDGALDGPGLAALDTPLAFGIIERILGGHGQAIEQPRPLTQIEQAVIAGPLRTLLERFAAAWAPVARLEFHPERVEMSPRSARIVGAREPVVAVILALGGEACVGDLTLCLPLAVVERLLPRGSAVLAAFHEAGGPPPAADGALRRALGGAPVRVAAELGRAHVSVLDLLNLQPGHVLRLDTHADDPLALTVEHSPYLAARPGLRGRKLAVQVIEGPDVPKP